MENDEGIIRIRVFNDENITSSENILYKVNHKVKMVNNDVLLHIPMHIIVLLNIGNNESIRIIRDSNYIELFSTGVNSQNVKTIIHDASALPLFYDNEINLKQSSNLSFTLPRGIMNYYGLKYYDVLLYSLYGCVDDYLLVISRVNQNINIEGYKLIYRNIAKMSQIKELSKSSNCTLHKPIERIMDLTNDMRMFISLYLKDNEKYIILSR